MRDKPFDLEAVKNGAEFYYVGCGDDFDDGDKRKFVAVLSNGDVAYETSDGVLNRARCTELRMRPRKREGWIRLYKEVNEIVACLTIYASEESARKSYAFAVCKIEWEE